MDLSEKTDSNRSSSEYHDGVWHFLFKLSEILNYLRFPTVIDSDTDEKEKQATVAIVSAVSETVK